MKFEERLVQLRKARGMSQEELAEKVGVSRQAVSKWETGDAQPDYMKLMALADALEVSLDDLCGREPVSAPVKQESSDTPEKPPKKRGWVFWLAAALVAILLLGAGILVGSLFAYRTVRGQSGSNPDPTLSQPITVSNVQFYAYEDSDKLFYQFVPSAMGENGSYQIAFVAPDGTEQVFDVNCGSAGCSGQVSLDGSNYDVCVIANRDGSQYVIPVAEGLCFDHDGGASWTPHDSTLTHHTESEEFSDHREDSHEAWNDGHNDWDDTHHDDSEELHH